MLGINDLPFKCKLSMSDSSPDISIEDLFTVAAQFDAKSGSSFHS